MKKQDKSLKEFKLWLKANKKLADKIRKELEEDE